MGLIEKRSNTSYLVRLRIKTNSKTQKITSNGDILIISLKSKPIKNKANKELISLIKNKLKISSNQIQIKTGSRSREKTVNITVIESVEKEDIIKKLLD